MIKPEGLHDLLICARGGDRDAADRLMRLLWPHLEQLAKRYSHRLDPTQSASDLLQDVSLRLCQRLNAFRGGANDSETAAMLADWVGQVFRSTAINLAKAHQAQRRNPPTRLVSLARGASGEGDEPRSPDSSPSSLARRKEQGEIVAAAMARIPDETSRRIVTLYFFEGRTLHDIAQSVGLSYDRTRARFHDVLRYLESELEGTL